MEESSNPTDDFRINEPVFHVPELSPWKCYMFGNDPKTGWGITYQPQKDGEPNRFVRWMMKICFACTWVKEDQSPDM